MSKPLSSPQITAAVEDYAKAIYALEAREGRVGTTALAGRLGVSAPSVSGMIRTLVERGLVTHEPYRGITLTPEGVQVALGVIRRHRLLELFLAETLGVPWDRVHREAEVLEHALSDELEERIAARLGDPSHVPHGDPIPTRDGTIDELGGVALADLAPGQAAAFARISDADAAELLTLTRRRISIGDHLDVLPGLPGAPAGTVRVRCRGAEHVLGPATAAAMRMLVEEQA